MAEGFLLVCMSFFFLLPNVFMIVAMANEKATTLAEHQTTSRSVHNQNEDHVSITGAAAAPVPLPRRAGGNHHQSSSKSAGFSISSASNPITTRTNNNQKDLKSSSAASIFPEHGKDSVASATPPSTATGKDHSVATEAVGEAHPHVETTPDENHGSEAAAAAQHGNSEEEHHEAAETSGAESPLSSRKLVNHRHHHYRPSDKSVAGGGVILGGLATTFLVSIACYIRATRRKNKNNKINNINIGGEKDPQESSSP